jgi:hypothetical protein
VEIAGDAALLVPAGDVEAFAERVCSLLQSSDEQ